MKFNSITTETKFKYLSKRALGTALITDTDYFAISPELHKSSMSWRPSYYTTDIEIKEAKAIELVSNYNDLPLIYYFDDKILDCKNIIFNNDYAFIGNEGFDWCPPHNQEVLLNVCAKNLNQFAYSNNTLKEIHFNPRFEQGSDTDLNGFRNIPNVTKITGLNLNGRTKAISTYYFIATALEWLEVLNVGVSIKLDECPKLTRECLINIFTNGLKTVTTTQTITLGSTLLAKLTDEDKKIATNKGWTLA